MKKQKVIFLHGMFRSGSTYLFNKFRQDTTFITFYEPLHHDLIRLQKKSLDIWKYDKEATNTMNHPELEKPHFYEYSNAFDSKLTSLPYYNTDFAYKEFFQVLKHDTFLNYINNLILVASDTQIPMLQFNRTSHRIDWFQQNYPDSFNIFLLRNPHDQFESYVSRSEKKDKNVFLAINICYILYHDTSKKYFSKLSKKTLSGIVLKDLSECMKISGKLTIQEHYAIFYYIWLHSLNHAQTNADLILDMDKLNHDQNYREAIQQKIFSYTNRKINFDDYNIKQNTSYSLDSKEFTDIEQKVSHSIQVNTNTNTNTNTKSNVFIPIDLKINLFSKLMNIFTFYGR